MGGSRRDAYQDSNRRTARRLNLHTLITNIQLIFFVCLTKTTMTQDGKAHIKLSAAQHRALLKALRGGDLGDVHSLDDIRLFIEPGHFGPGGDGLWSTLGSEVKKVQKSGIVRGLEKKAVNYGAKALRGATEGALDGVGDTVATAIGIPDSSRRRTSSPGARPRPSRCLRSS